MLVFNNINAFQNHLSNLKEKKVGFVPTMGALHDGHLQLIKNAQIDCDIVVVSIFVNPLQFNNKEDFEKYPNTLDDDILKLKKTGCHILFAPVAKELYFEKPNLRFDFGYLENVMEGKFRPGHFNGVAIIVSKLLNIVKPQVVFFGQKDLQQCAIVKCLIKDLSYPVEMYVIPTIREENGLAMSSRNMRLSPQGKSNASNIYKGLQSGKDALLNSTKIDTIKMQVKSIIEENSAIVTEYIEVVDIDTLKEVTDQTKVAAICFAGFLEGVRLIDNIIIDFAKI